MAAHSQAMMSPAQHVQQDKLSIVGPYSKEFAQQPGLALAGAPLTPPVSNAFTETKTISLEWKISGLKHLFDGSRGDVKSKCLKSQPFANGQWELYMYANSGSDYVSLYLSAIPTLEERERGLRLASKRSSSQALRSAFQSQLSHHSTISTASESEHMSAQHQQGNHLNVHNEPTWSREGAYRFSFEIRALGMRNPVKQMEAADHVFSSEARNWGWQAFARRSDVYYNNPTVKSQDALTINCSITYAASAPTSAPWNELEQSLVPNNLMTAFTAMFDNPSCSDVRFIVRSRSRETGQKQERYIYATKAVLMARADYFRTMFRSGFLEGADSHRDSCSNLSRPTVSPRSRRRPGLAVTDSDLSSVDSEDDQIMSEVGSEDNDEDAGGIDKDICNDILAKAEDEEEVHTAVTSIPPGDSSRIDFGSAGAAEAASPTSSRTLETSGFDDEDGIYDEASTDVNQSTADRFPGLAAAGYLITSRGGSVNAGHPTTMRSVSTAMSLPLAHHGKTSPRVAQPFSKEAESQERHGIALRSHDDRFTNIVITDASYAVYRALIYYLYTDKLTFNPLTSVYVQAQDTAELRGLPFPYTSRRQFFDATMGDAGSTSVTTQLDHGCSAKAMYKLADKLDFPELKARARNHIVASLSAEILPYEVFGEFSNQFPEIRAVEVQAMLSNWREIRHGQAMRNVFRLIRQDPDRFPAFEQVWEQLILHLEYPSPITISESQQAQGRAP